MENEFEGHDSEYGETSKQDFSIILKKDVDGLLHYERSCIGDFFSLYCSL